MWKMFNFKVCFFNAQSSATLAVSETFPTCNEINSFIKSGKGVEGEPTPVAGFYTIDVDGPGDLAPFEVYCSPPNTKVDTGELNIYSGNIQVFR